MLIKTPQGSGIDIDNKYWGVATQVHTGRSIQYTHLVMDTDMPCEGFDSTKWTLEEGDTILEAYNYDFICRNPDNKEDAWVVDEELFFERYKTNGEIYYTHILKGDYKED